MTKAPAAETKQDVAMMYTLYTALLLNAVHIQEPA
jgi:hypothetical protein